MKQKSAPSRPKKNPEIRPRRETFLKAALYTLVCLWMFILGLLVGRGTAPVRFDVERLQDKLTALKAATVDETTEHYREAFQELDKELDLGFHEALKNEETDLPPSMPSAPVTTLTATQPQQTGTPEEDPEAAVPKKTKDPEFQKPETDSAAWTIQVAATKDESQGNVLVERLHTLGFEAHLTKKAIPGKGTWYRVRIGEYASREAAESDLERLEEERFSPIIIAP